MRIRDDDNLKVLALFARCTECRCTGFRPILEDEQAVEDGGLFLVDFKLVRGVDGDALCRLCHHAIDSHAAHTHRPGRVEQEKLIQMANDTHGLHSRMSTTEDTDELHIVYQVFQLFLSALKKWSTTVDVPFGFPNFEAISVYSVVTNFAVSSQETNNVKQIQHNIHLASKLLTLMNTWKVPPPSVYHEVVPRVDRMQYRLFYSRWMYYVLLPQRFKSLKQYETVEIFGQKALQLFLKFAVNLAERGEDVQSRSKVSVCDLGSFMTSLLNFLDNPTKSDVKLKNILPSGVDLPKTSAMEFCSLSSRTTRPSTTVVRRRHGLWTTM
ncbi:hypothetical protein Y032_0342g3024 [Ancylostoma ceylanicum]|uniref:PCAF N-terminal domain-containing protein n=1 Tax=Ancylostoma ceylanicum TaxID=53326 RepID=A0A016RXK6_9BILA|nr:hypothetical protein Y032_0342g3024 [Ancylostoma ceylanicum]